MTCVIENLTYIKNLDEIKLNETINLECLYTDWYFLIIGKIFDKNEKFY